MKSVDELYGQMMAEFARRTGVEASGTGDLAVRLYAVAAELYSLYIQADWVARQCFPQSAEGEYLERHAFLRGVARRSAAKAQGVLRFSVDAPPAADLAISAGTVCMTAGLVRFETTEPVVLKAGCTTVDAHAQAVEPGGAGNVAAGSVLSMAVAPVGVSRCTNPQPFTGGMDEEGDEALRERVLETYQRLPNGANAAFYQQGALSFSQVAAASVIPRKRGIGTVDVVIATDGGMPGEDLLARVGEYFESRREIAVDVLVSAPAALPVEVRVQIQAAEGRDPEKVRAEVESAVAGFFSGRGLGRDVLRAELGRLVYGVDGVANYKVTAPGEDVAVRPHELPTLKTLAVEETP